MQTCRSNHRFSISGPACILLATLVLVLPLRWIVAGLVAGVFHEACHAAAVLLCGGRIVGMSVHRRGAVMHLAAMSAGRELISALAGPAGSILLMLFVRYIPRISFCGMIHAAYNLFPIYPLDGGRALRCFLQMLIPGNTDTVCQIVQTVFMTALWVGAVYLTLFQQLGLFPIIAALTLTTAKNRP